MLAVSDAILMFSYRAKTTAAAKTAKQPAKKETSKDETQRPKQQTNVQAKPPTVHRDEDDGSDDSEDEEHAKKPQAALARRQATVATSQKPQSTKSAPAAEPDDASEDEPDVDFQVVERKTAPPGPNPASLREKQTPKNQQNSSRNDSGDEEADASPEPKKTQSKAQKKEALKQKKALAIGKKTVKKDPAPNKPREPAQKPSLNGSDDANGDAEDAVKAQNVTRNGPKTATHNGFAKYVFQSQIPFRSLRIQSCDPEIGSRRRCCRRACEEKNQERGGRRVKAVDR